LRLKSPQLEDGRQAVGMVGVAEGDEHEHPPPFSSGRKTVGLYRETLFVRETASRAGK
jgi:hypothetical protein